MQLAYLPRSRMHAQGPHSHILMMEDEGEGGGGGPSVFCGSEKKTRLFWVVKKELRDFFGCAKK